MHLTLVPGGYDMCRGRQDTLRTAERCEKEAMRELSKGQSVVIDNTNT